uniref:SUEL-type lectin domain-containing protein n=1 Tax=Neogobius melanostomus TaxID=47308 RepID=A0A8C6SH01_9GOBI
LLFLIISVCSMLQSVRGPARVILPTSAAVHSGKVIRIHRADYGRADRTICSQGRPSEQVQNVNCAASTANDLVAQMCDGKSHCSVSASNSVFGDPCYGTYKYLCYLLVPCLLALYKGVCGCMFDLNAVSLSGSGQVIHIDSADYGRSDRTTCSQGRPSQQLQNVNCASYTATDLVAEMCNGKSRCSVRASNSVFGDPCFGTYKYLQVSYSCKRSSIGE